MTANDIGPTESQNGHGLPYNQKPPPSMDNITLDSRAVAVVPMNDASNEKAY